MKVIKLRKITEIIWPYLALLVLAVSIAPRLGFSQPSEALPTASPTPPLADPLSPVIKSPFTLPAEGAAQPVNEGEIGAEDSTSAHLTPPPLEVIEKRPEDLLLWELELAQSGYAINRTTKNLSRLIVALEKLVYSRCMRDVEKTLHYNGPSEDPECTTYLGELERIDLSSPAGICARMGISASECREAVQAVEFNSYSTSGASTTDSSTSPADELEAQLATSKSIEKISEVDSKLYNARSGADPNSPEANAEIRKLLEEAVTVSCKVIRTHVEPKGGTDTTHAEESLSKELSHSLKGVHPEVKESIFKNPRKPSTTSRTSFGDGDTVPLLAMGETKIPDVTPSPVIPTQAYNHFRSVSDHCYKYINEAIAHDPTMAVAQCARFGLYTPQCLDARRIERAKRSAQSMSGTPGTARGSTTERNKKNKGFETF